MKKPISLLFLGLFLILVNRAFAAPWDYTDSIKLSISREGTTGTMLRMYPYMDSLYTDQYGACPNIIIWDDDPSVPAYFSVQLEFMPATGTHPSFSTIENHIYLFLESMEKADSMWVPIDSLAFDTTGGAWLNPVLLYYGFSIDLRKTPIPNDGATWKITPQFWASPPPGGELLASTTKLGKMFALRMDRKTPLDTLQWGFDKNLFDEDPEACKSMLIHFPNRLALLQSAYQHARKSGDCDTLKHYAEGLLHSKYNRLDYIYMDRGFLAYDNDGVDPDPGPPRLTHSDWEYIVGRVLGMCGDTSGFAQYEPPPDEPLPPFEVEKWREFKDKEKGKILERN